jgi:hypothetical protein
MYVESYFIYSNIKNATMTCEEGITKVEGYN